MSTTGGTGEDVAGGGLAGGDVARAEQGGTVDVVSREDAELLRALARMWESVDAVPDDVVTRAVFAVQLERMDAELLALEADVLELAGARSSESVRTLRFAGDEVAIMVTITAGPVGRGTTSPGGVRIDGWVSPARSGTMELRRESGDPSRQRVDVHGRFAFPRVEPAMAQLVFRPAPDDVTAGSVACPPVRL